MYVFAAQGVLKAFVLNFNQNRENKIPVLAIVFQFLHPTSCQPHCLSVPGCMATCGLNTHICCFSLCVWGLGWLWSPLTWQTSLLRELHCLSDTLLCQWLISVFLLFSLPARPLFSSLLVPFSEKQDRVASVSVSANGHHLKEQ